MTEKKDKCELCVYKGVSIECCNSCSDFSNFGGACSFCKYDDYGSGDEPCSDCDDGSLFDEKKEEGGCRSNNNSYEALNIFFQLLRPHFEDIGVNVFNVNTRSNLKAFDFVEYGDAINFAVSEIGDVSLEKTNGMYDDLKLKMKRKKEEETKTEIVEKGWGHHVPNKVSKDKPLLNVVKKASPEYTGHVIELDEMWEKRQELVEIYPDCATVIATVQDRLKVLEEKKKGCKGCSKGRIFRVFYDYIVKRLKEDYKDVFDAERYVRMGANATQLKEFRDGR